VGGEFKNRVKGTSCKEQGKRKISRAFKQKEAGRGRASLAWGMVAGVWGK